MRVFNWTEILGTSPLEVTLCSLISTLFFSIKLIFFIFTTLFSRFPMTTAPQVVLQGEIKFFNWTHVLVLSSRCPHSFQQQCSFRRASRKPESRKVEEDPSPTQTSEARAPNRTTSPPLWEQPGPPKSPRAYGRLLRPLVFTVGVSCSSLRANASQMLAPHRC